MNKGLVGLDHDTIVKVAEHLSVRAAVSLALTCQTLSFVAHTEYLWRVWFTRDHASVYIDHPTKHKDEKSGKLVPWSPEAAAACEPLPHSLAFTEAIRAYATDVVRSMNQTLLEDGLLRAPAPFVGAFMAGKTWRWLYQAHAVTIKSDSGFTGAGTLVPGYQEMLRGDFVDGRPHGYVVKVTAALTYTTMARTTHVADYTLCDAGMRYDNKFVGTVLSFSSDGISVDTDAPETDDESFTGLSFPSSLERARMVRSWYQDPVVPGAHLEHVFVEDADIRKSIFSAIRTVQTTTRDGSRVGFYWPPSADRMLGCTIRARSGPTVSAVRNRRTDSSIVTVTRGNAPHTLRAIGTKGAAIFGSLTSLGSLNGPILMVLPNGDRVRQMYRCGTRTGVYDYEIAPGCPYGALAGQRITSSTWHEVKPWPGTLLPTEDTPLVRLFWKAVWERGPFYKWLSPAYRTAIDTFLSCSSGTFDTLVADMRVAFTRATLIDGHPSEPCNLNHLF